MHLKHQAVRALSLNTDELWTKLTEHRTQHAPTIRSY